MCYNSSETTTKEEKTTIGNEFGLTWEGENTDPLFYVSGFSHPKLPVITGEGKYTRLNWGLIPNVSWVKDWKTAIDIRVKTLNCISEEAESKPSFRGAIKNGQFCVIHLDGFYEWHHYNDKLKFPHYIYPKEDRVFYIAGLYDQWVNEEIDEVHNTFTMLTTAANERMEWIHNSKKRMPVILEKKDVEKWLDKSVSYSEKRDLLKPFDHRLMADHPVSNLITSKKEQRNVPLVRERFEYIEIA